MANKSTATKRRTTKSKFGSVRKLGSGRFQIRYPHPISKRSITGEKTFATKTEADRYLSIIDADISRQLWKDPSATSKMKLADFIELWLGHKQFKSEKGREDYRYTFEQYVSPYLGSRYVSEIDVPMIRQWEKDLQTYFDDRPASGSGTMGKAWRYLKSAFNSAIDDYELIRDNPCRKRTIRTEKPKEKIPLEPNEIRAMIEALPDHYRALWALLCETGMRKGEVSALTRADLFLDDETAIIQIDKQVQKLGAGVYKSSDPKSDAGIRSVSISPEMVSILRDHLNRFTKPESDALIFTTRNGTNVCDTLYQAIKRAGVRIGRPDVCVHLSRHTAITYASMVNATPAEIKRRFGHSSFEVSQMYQHTNDQHAIDVTTRVAQYLSDTSNVTPIRKSRTA